MKITLTEGQRIAVDFPTAFADKHTAILGTTGAGKTSVAKAALVEPLLIVKKRVHIIDPKTDWWGLRLMADGKRQAAKIYIFGGERGDYPLRVADVPAITEAFARSSDSAIFDTKGMIVEERMQFFIKYAETILRKNKGPLNIIIDEAHLFLPQQGAKVAGLAPRMLHVGNEMLSSGRSQGLRVALLTQRPQKLHKDSLTLVQTLIAMRLFHPLDRAAIEAWMKEQADPKTGEAVMGSLSSLKDGEGWAWSPVDRYLERIQFPMPLTFDSSKAPEMDDADVPVLDPINIEDLTGRLGKIEEERKANDPKLLQAKIRELEKAKAVVERVEIPVADPEAQHIAHSAGFLDGFAAGYRIGHENGIGEVQDLIQEMTEAVSNIETPALRTINEEREKYMRSMGIELKYNPPVIPRGSPLRAGDGLAPHPPARKPPEAKPEGRFKPPSTVSDGGTLSRPQQKIVEALEIWHALGHNAPSREQVAAIAGYSPSSGGYGNLLSSLKTTGIIDAPGSGRLALINVHGSRNIDLGEAGRILLAHLSDPQRKIIRAFDPPGDTLSREQVAERTEYSATSGGFANLLSQLSTLGILRRPRAGFLELSPWAAELLQ